MRVGRVVLCAGGVVLSWGVLAVLLSGSLHAASVPREQARATALARVQGTVVSERYQREGARWVYDFDVRLPSGASEPVVEVAVDADDGTIVAIHPPPIVALGRERE
jgi:hypothetical protein